MKQLSALGARRHFYRSPRRMRALRGDMDDGDMMGPGFGYFNGKLNHNTQTGHFRECKNHHNRIEYIKEENLRAKEKL